MEKATADSPLSRAIIFAARAHEGFTRKGSEIPYIVHPMEVCAIAASLDADTDVLIAALLHDTIEDAGVTAEQIRENFGPTVAIYVCAETENKYRELAPAASWKKRKEESVNRLKDECLAVKKIALADKLANLRAIYSDMKKSGDAVWERFNVKDSRLHEWYYKAMAHSLSELSNYAAYSEFTELIEKVFTKEQAGEGSQPDFSLWAEKYSGSFEATDDLDDMGEE